MSFEEFFQMFSEFGEAYMKVRCKLCEINGTQKKRKYLLMPKNIQDIKGKLHNLQMCKLFYIGASQTALLQ